MVRGPCRLSSLGHVGIPGLGFRVYRAQLRFRASGLRSRARWLLRLGSGGRVLGATLSPKVQEHPKRGQLSSHQGTWRLLSGDPKP